MLTIEMERSVEEPATAANLEQMRRAAEAYFEIKDVVRKETHVSADRKRFVCIREARDTESVRRSLESLASLPRGSFLEELELPDLLGFNAWCIAERERARAAHCDLLRHLVTRLRNAQRRALRHARTHAQVDGRDVSAPLTPLGLLLETRKTSETKQAFENVRRMFREVGGPGRVELE